MKRLLILLALLLPMPALAQTYTAEGYATNLKPFIGKKFDGDLVLANVSSEGNTLIVVVDAAAGWGDTPRTDATPLLLSGFCGPASSVEFFKTNWLRVDTLDHGADLRNGEPVNVCPAKPAGQ